MDNNLQSHLSPSKLEANRLKYLKYQICFLSLFPSSEGGSLLVNDSPTTTPNLAPTPPLFHLIFLLATSAHVADQG